jgi:aldehyde:ferredoxin oxidoreductase
MAIKGYSGVILHVDLSSGKFEEERPPEAFYRKYIGGGCMGAYYLLKMMKPGIDALSPENVLVFTLGPITGAALSGSARHCVTTKSPQTGGFATGESGGFWAPELRFAGFDGIVITGKSPKPVYLWIKDGKYELRDASKVWGKITGEAQDAIRAELGDDKVRVALIGPSGEKLVRFAAIVNELKHFNGRSGVGAVMGSKNLKAIAVRGTRKPEFHNLERLTELGKLGAKRVAENEGAAGWKKYGTTLNVNWNTDIGGLPTKNWTMGQFEGADKLTAEAYHDDWMDKPGTCWACAQSCKRDIKEGIEKPWKVETRYGGPEYETLGMLGPNCMVGDMNAIAKANEIASKYCVDSIALGGVIGFVMECFEKGILSTKDTGGVQARFGNGEDLVKLCELVVAREGFGDAMAEGSARLARKLGPEAVRICVTVKDKEFPAHMPTSKGIMTLAYAVNPFGPDHVSTEHDGCLIDPSEALKNFGFYDSVPKPETLDYEKTKLMCYSQRFVSGIDSMSVCQFTFHTWTIYDFREFMDAINAATGWNYSLYEFMLLGERRINMMKAFNAREGFDAKDDMLPERLFEDALVNEGRGSGRKVDRKNFLEMRDEYYRLSGWDEKTGNPTDTKYRELGLGWLCDKKQERITI